MWIILFALVLIGCADETESMRNYELFDANAIDSAVESASDVAQEAEQEAETLDASTPDTADAQETDAQPDVDAGPELIDCGAGSCLKTIKCLRASDGFVIEFVGCCGPWVGCGAVPYITDTPGECVHLAKIETAYPGFSCGSPKP